VWRRDEVLQDLILKGLNGGEGRRGRRSSGTLRGFGLAPGSFNRLQHENYRMLIGNLVGLFK
jgi:hypothetical protein